ncbi:acyl-CoA thioesterase domain-containing protein [Gordonia sp. (in: high G+C Gram-positive bacteria)]|uniref:acyl-CoA thioesterase domain-containing protein n=1 Tax=Gordonia sp. (in: high G+C Gram-positive bacteria) TaxID=84139 RepID=UPI003C70E207
MSDKSFFTVGDDGRYDPTPYALGLWGPDTLNGPAICAIAAYAAENFGSREGFAPARFTIELFKSAHRLPTATTTTMLRDGNRIRVVQVSVLQYDVDDNEILVAQGNVVFLKQGTNPPGGRWVRPEGTDVFTPPDEDEDDRESYRAWFQSGDREWSRSMSDSQNTDRLRIFNRPFNPVEDVAPTPFQRAVILAESTSLVTNSGDGGIGFINCDLTVAIARLPEGLRLGLEADSHIEDSGLSVGTANLYDEHGKFGIGLVTAIDNTAAMIDFTKVNPHSLRTTEMS